MNTPGTRSSRLRQQGFVSVIVVLALILVVAVVLKQSVQITATKALNGLQQSDSVAALAQAQNGTEIALQKLAAAFNGSADLATACVPGNLGLTSENTTMNTASGPGSFSLVAAMVSVNGYCKIRVKGTMRAASRTVETWANSKVTYGTAGFGTNPKLTLTNPWSDVKAIGLFNTGWGVQSSDGHTVTGNADCTDCNTTNKLWYSALSGSANNIGGAGNYSASMGFSATASYTHTLSDARNYAMVGHVLGGTSSLAPTTQGSLSSANNNNDQGTTTAIATVAKGSAWCTDNTSNAVIIGVSAKGPGITNGLPDLSGQYKSAKFYYSGDATGPAIKVLATASASKTYVHYPDANANVGLAAPIAWGDVFVELYYFYQAPINITVNSSSGSQLTLSQTYTPSLAGRYLQPSNKINNATYIQSHVAGTNLITLSQAPSASVNNSTICTGICGFIPYTTNSKVDMSFAFEMPTSTTVNKAWVGGIVCLKGVDDSKVQPVTNPTGINILQWHEVLSTDTALF